MKIAKVIGVLLVGPLLGILAGLVLGAFAIPAQTAGGRAPGDGFLVMGYVFLGLFVSIPVSVALAGVVWFRSSAAGPKSN
ncbi:MAG: hypothetical protein WBC78_19485 [Candidatus Sulfotelmatobacter sp.]